MRKFFLSISAICFMVVSSSGFSQSLEQTPSDAAITNTPTDVIRTISPIKSLAELNQHIETVSPEVSPLGKLSDEGLSRFTSSVTFNEKGITGFSYEEFAGMASADVHKILELFGVGRTLKLIKNMRVTTRADVVTKSCGGIFYQTGCGDELNPGDRDHMYCASLGSCGPRSQWVCTANC